jgi:hypothetical protein
MLMGHLLFQAEASQQTMYWLVVVVLVVTRN